MRSNIYRISRKELYRRVWETPMSRLAAEFGLSDNGLAKICKRHDIPTPNRGYWAKKSAGNCQLKKFLPRPSSSEVIEITPTIKLSADNPEDTDISRLLELEQNSPVITVKNQLRNPHPIISLISDALESGGIDNFGRLVPRGRKTIGVSVSKATLRRSLRIIDAVIMGLLERGFAVHLGDQYFEVEIHSERLGFRIMEKVTVVKIQPTDDDLQGSYDFGHSRTERKPSGKLCLMIEAWNYLGSRNFRKNWSDSERGQLEEFLNDFVVGLIKGAVKLEQYRRKEEEKKRIEREIALQRAKERQRLEELKQKIEAEKQRFAMLLQDSENHQASARLRVFITEVEAEHKKGNSVYVGTDDLEKWIEWANNQADRLDPLKASPPSIMDQEDELPKEQNPGFPWLKR